MYLYSDIHLCLEHFGQASVWLYLPAGPHQDQNQIETGDSERMQAKQYPQYEAVDGRVADSADLHPILASIYEAADFVPLNSTTAVQAAGMAELLCGLLHPYPGKRMQTRHPQEPVSMVACHFQH